MSAQALQALDLANDIRSSRALLLEPVRRAGSKREGGHRLAYLLTQGHDSIERSRIGWLLTQPYGWSQSSVDKLLRSYPGGISPMRRVNELTVRQVDWLIDALEGA